MFLKHSIVAKIHGDLEGAAQFDVLWQRAAYECARELDHRNDAAADVVVAGLGIDYFAGVTTACRDRRRISA